MPGTNSDMEFSLEELEALFKEEPAASQPQETDDASGQSQPVDEHVTLDNIETSKVFSQRLNAHADKKVKEERERIAKEFGYESYEEMQKSKEKKILEDNGLNSDDVAPAIEQIVEERLKNDPRMKELDGYREQRMQEFAKKELEEIKTLTNGQVTTLEQIPKDVLDDWKKSGSLKKSYIALHGEELITMARTQAPKSTTSHLQNPSGPPPQPSEYRALTDEEKKVWKLFNPSLTDEELNKKQIKKE